MIFHPAKNASFYVYAHEPGEEIWFHFFWFPELMDANSFGRELYMADHQYLKEVYQAEDGECRHDWSMHQYTSTVQVQGGYKNTLAQQ